MVTKIIPIPSNDNKIYRQILGVLNFAMKLTPQEIDVLGELIKLNHEYSALPEDKRARFILSTDMRKEIRTDLNMEEKQLNSLIARLKKRKFMGLDILSSDGIIHKELLFNPDEEGFKIEIILKKTAGIPEKEDKPVVETESTEVIEPIKTSVDIPSGRPDDFEESTFDFELSRPE